MACITYIPKRFTPASLALIVRARAICEEYQEQGLDLTLRQVYYQFVSRGYLPNKDTEYKRLGAVISDARLAGLLDWNHIIDRTRNLRGNSHWSSPDEIVQAAAGSYMRERWEGQPTRVEVWIEKDALVGVLQAVCPRLDVPYFSCRGYTSQSEVWAAAARLRSYVEDDGASRVVVIHLGDHDPSGIDMSRDIEDRLRLFWAVDAGLVDPEQVKSELIDGSLEENIRATVADLDEEELPLTINRIALNMDQVRRYKPPPNPAKITDSRAEGYIRKFGNESWELDALDPKRLIDLVENAVLAERDEDIWDVTLGRERRERSALQDAARRWNEVTAFLRGKADDDAQ